MNPILRNIIVTLVAIFVGGLVNSGIVSLSSMLIDTPDGFDMMSQESYDKYKHLLSFMVYVGPLLAHALGTLVGAFIIAKFVTTRSRTFALGVGFFFLIGGILANYLIPGPGWFAPVDLIFAYIPMALLGWMLAGSRKD